MMAENYYKNIMSDSSVLSNTRQGSRVDPAPDASDPEHRGKHSSGRGKIFKLLVFLGLIALGVELIWFLGITPFRPFTRIEVNGLSYYDRDSLLAYSGITPQSSYIFTNTKEMETLLAALPRIESVQVIKRYPGRLEINLQNRRPAAMALAIAGDRTVPVLFDHQGVIYQIGSGFSRETLANLPVISGLLIESPFLGMRLPARLLSFLEDLESIRNRAPELLHAVSEIRVDRRSSEGFDYTLYLFHHNIRVRLSGLNEEILRYTLLMADVLAVREPGIAMIDFRGGMASYYPKGGPL
jgi:cell division protein FtsQ